MKSTFSYSKFNSLACSTLVEKFQNGLILLIANQDHGPRHHVWICLRKTPKFAILPRKLKPKGVNKTRKQMIK